MPLLGAAAEERNGLWTRWHDELYEKLPPAQHVKQRNAAITATYARFYKTRPDLFKWAGAAAFASHRVGLALKPYGFIEAIAEAVAAVVGDKPDLEPDIELLRQTNNQVFHDIGWAHAAFLAGGFAAIQESLHDGVPSYFQSEDKSPQMAQMTPIGASEELLLICICEICVICGFSVWDYVAWRGRIMHVVVARAASLPVAQISISA